jgi:uncharacterized protein (DUF433 family)
MLSQHAILSHITRNPEVLGGKPIIRGTRIAVDLVVGWVTSGVSIEQILDDYPNLMREDIEAALAFHEQEQARTEIRAL